MAYFLLQGAYSPDAWKALLNKPENRIDTVRPIIENLGGKVETGYFSFGEYDIVVIMQLLDNISAAAFSLAVAAGGAFKSHKTTPLMTADEGVEAMKKGAALSNYRAPGK